MQVSNTFLVIAVELYLLLLIGMLVLFFYSRKQKNLVSRQQNKLLDLIKEIRSTTSTPIQAVQDHGYKYHLNQELAITEKHFLKLHPEGKISGNQAENESLEQRILALRYAFLRSEELSTTEDQGSERYWSIFQQTLGPLLQLSPDLGSSSNSSSTEELEMYKKRVENLEKFKKLFFDLEAQWNAAQTDSEGYHAQLLSLSNQVANPEAYQLILQNYQGIFGEFSKSVKKTSSSANFSDPKTINIIRQDPRAAEEIIKLRNVAADQYRVINNLQRKLEEVGSDEQRLLIVKELEQQLQKQIRFVQESDACVQLLEEELEIAHEKIASQELIIGDVQKIDVENSQIKDTLHDFTLESRDLLANLEILEQENLQLKEQLQSLTGSSDATSQANLELSPEDQQTLVNLQKQYAELEERYLALKMK